MLAFQIDNFLTSQENKKLASFVVDNEAGFLPTTTSSQEIDYRQSLVLYDIPAVAQPVRDRISIVLPAIFDALDIPPFDPTRIEAQITTHNDGHYYKAHNDNGSPDCADRILTYVYYFHRPRAFDGGELLMVDTGETIEPRNNTIVFFESRLMHSVMQISCPSGEFADGRFTVNGWLRNGKL